MSISLPAGGAAASTRGPIASHRAAEGLVHDFCPGPCRLRPRRNGREDLEIESCPSQTGDGDADRVCGEVVVASQHGVPAPQCHLLSLADPVVRKQRKVAFGEVELIRLERDLCQGP